MPTWYRQSIGARMRRFLRAGLVIFTAPLPWLLKRPLLRLFLGYKLHRKARIGWSIVDAEEVVLEEGARIGHLNVIRRLERLQMGEGAMIGSHNWISGFPNLTWVTPGERHLTAERRVEFLMGTGAAIMQDHRIDCTDSVQLGEFTWLTGARTNIYTHGYSPAEGRMIWAPVVIGSFGIVNGGATVAAGATIADRCVVGGMAFVAGDLPQPLRLYAGVPAREVKPLDPQGLWFDREHRAALMHYRRPQLHAEWEAEVAAEVTVPES